MLKKFSVLLMVFLLPLMAVRAQGAPEQINAALAKLSEKVGQNLTLARLDNWRWSQDNYPDTSLGCPQPGRAYAQVVTPGYKFLLTFGGIVYDYRVSVDGQNVILCGETRASDIAAATPTPIPPEALDTSIPCPAPETGVVYLPTRLTVGMQARVVPGPPNNQRSEPSRSGALLGDIPGGGIVEIVAGPQCADQLVWWQVNYDGRIGWTVEGREDVYWLEPVPGVPLPATRQPVTVENASTLAQFSVVEGSFIDRLAASPDGNTIAVLGGRGTDGVWWYDLRALDQVPNLLRGTAQLMSLDYNADGSLLVLGDTQGNIRVWDVSPRAPLLEATFLQGHQSDTSAVAYSPNGSLIASVGSIANTTANVNKANAIIVWDVATVEQALVLAGHTARVNALEFSPDGTLIASASGDASGADNTVRLWNAATGEQIAALEGHSAAVQDIQFTPNGTTLVSAGLDGSVIVWDVASREQSRALSTAGTPIRALALNPDGTLLAAAGGEQDTASEITVWNFASGEQAAALQGHTDSVGDLTFSTDGTLLISLADDLSLRFWGVPAAG